MTASTPHYAKRSSLGASRDLAIDWVVEKRLDTLERHRSWWFEEFKSRDAVRPYVKRMTELNQWPYGDDDADYKRSITPSAVTIACLVKLGEDLKKRLEEHAKEHENVIELEDYMNAFFELYLPVRCMLRDYLPSQKCEDLSETRPHSERIQIEKALSDTRLRGQKGYPFEDWWTTFLFILSDTDFERMRTAGVVPVFGLTKAYQMRRDGTNASQEELRRKLGRAGLGETCVFGFDNYQMSYRHRTTLIGTFNLVTAHSAKIVGSNRLGEYAINPNAGAVLYSHDRGASVKQSVIEFLDTQEPYMPHPSFLFPSTCTPSFFSRLILPASVFETPRKITLPEFQSLQRGLRERALAECPNQPRNRAAALGNTFPLHARDGAPDSPVLILQDLFYMCLLLRFSDQAFRLWLISVDGGIYAKLRQSLRHILAIMRPATHGYSALNPDSSNVNIRVSPEDEVDLAAAAAADVPSQSDTIPEIVPVPVLFVQPTTTIAISTTSQAASIQTTTPSNPLLELDDSHAQALQRELRRRSTRVGTKKELPAGEIDSSAKSVEEFRKKCEAEAAKERIKRLKEDQEALANGRLEEVEDIKKAHYAVEKMVEATIYVPLEPLSNLQGDKLRRALVGLDPELEHAILLDHIPQFVEAEANGNSNVGIGARVTWNDKPLSALDEPHCILLIAHLRGKTDYATYAFMSQSELVNLARKVVYNSQRGILLAHCRDPKKTISDVFSKVALVGMVMEVWHLNKNCSMLLVTGGEGFDGPLFELGRHTLRNSDGELVHFDSFPGAVDLLKPFQFCFALLVNSAAGWATVRHTVLAVHENDIKHTLAVTSGAKQGTIADEQMNVTALYCILDHHVQILTLIFDLLSLGGAETTKKAMRDFFFCLVSLHRMPSAKNVASFFLDAFTLESHSPEAFNKLMATLGDCFALWSEHLNAMLSKNGCRTAADCSKVFGNFRSFAKAQEFVDSYQGDDTGMGLREAVESLELSKTYNVADKKVLPASVVEFGEIIVRLFAKIAGNEDETNPLHVRPTFFFSSTNKLPRSLARNVVACLAKPPSSEAIVNDVSEKDALFPSFSPLAENALPNGRLTGRYYKFNPENVSEGFVEVRCNAKDAPYHARTPHDFLEMIRRGITSWQPDGQGWVIPKELLRQEP
jgi:hypothetical protein